MIVREAKYDDFEKVYPLLYKLNNKTLSKNDWKRIFENNFETDMGFCGYVIEDEDEIHGFLGAVFSNRIIAGKEYKFCNLTSWIVEKKYRAKSLILLMKIHKLKGYVFTNFTPSKTVYPILKKLGYKDVENRKFLIKPIPVFSSKIRILTSGFENLLDDNELKIYEQHKKFNLGFFIAKSKSDYCFIVYRKKKYFPAKLKKITAGKINMQLAEIEYVSNPNFFSNNTKEIMFKASIKKTIASFTVYEKYLPESIVKSSKIYKTHRKYVYKGDLPENKIDILFSEIVILDL
ncbi:MAG: hypothetical protein GXO80_02890 [Chlorobi bacterium]|nr:hypothetical protein [Chlorobiota bacterium]